MPAKGYRLSPLAEADLEDIWRYTFETWSADQADRYLRDLVAVFEDLAASRKPGRPTDIREGYFKQSAGAHVIYFRRSGRQGLEPGPVDSLAGAGDSREPRHRLASPGDVDRFARFDPIDQLAQTGPGVSKIDRIQVSLLSR